MLIKFDRKVEFVFGITSELEQALLGKAFTCSIIIWNWKKKIGI